MSRERSKPYKVQRGALKHQIEFINSEYAYPALVAGFGSGKTEAGVLRVMNLKFNSPERKHLSIAYYLPTHSLIKDIALPRFHEYLQATGLTYAINKTDGVIAIKDWGKIILRTLSNPERIIGYEVSDSVVDELDTLPMHKADEAWKKIIARNRQQPKSGKKIKNTCAVITTPEGYRFVYSRWKEEEHKGDNLRKGYHLIKASTYDNFFLPDDYIENLTNSYPPELINAYLRGEFVNLNGKPTYTNYNRDRNDSSLKINPRDVLFIGMDFNVGNMTAVVHKLDDEGNPHAVDEFAKILDTPAMIKAIQARYHKNLFPKIWVFPDASGGSRKTNDASVSDISLLSGAGFIVDAPAANPPVKDRVMAMNMKFLTGDGKIEYFVNVNMCPVFVKALEQQVNDDGGAPDKTGGFDHPNDAAGYYMHRRFAISNMKHGRIQMKWS